MPYKGGVQLLPETPHRPSLASYTSGNRRFWTGIGLGVALVVIGATLSGYGASVQDKIGTIDGQLAQLEATRNRDQEKALVAVARQSRLVRSLMVDKVYWSQALAQMERMTQSSVHFINLAGSAETGTIAFSGIADSHATVARQLAAFVGGMGVRDAVIDLVKAVSQGVQFDGKLVIDIQALLNKSVQP